MSLLSPPGNGLITSSSSSSNLNNDLVSPASNASSQTEFDGGIDSKELHRQLSEVATFGMDSTQAMTSSDTATPTKADFNSSKPTELVKDALNAADRDKKQKPKYLSKFQHILPVGWGSWRTESNTSLNSASSGEMQDGPTTDERSPTIPRSASGSQLSSLSSLSYPKLNFTSPLRSSHRHCDSDSKINIQDEPPSAKSITFDMDQSKPPTRPSRGMQRLPSERRARSLPAPGCNGDSSISSDSSASSSSESVPLRIRRPSKQQLIALNAYERSTGTMKAVTDSLKDAINDSIDSLPSLPQIHADGLWGKLLGEHQHSRETKKYKQTTKTPSIDVAEHTQRSPENVTSAFDKLEGNVVILGGYRGSILRDAETKRRLWVPFKVGLNIRRPNLTLGLEDEAVEKSTETVIPGGMIKHIGPVDLGRRLITRLRHREKHSDGKMKLHIWGYDWRLPLPYLAKQLNELLTKLKAEDERGRGAIVIAHSMGCLVTLGAMADKTELFRGVLFAGGPFGGCINIMGPFRNGDVVLRNHEILSAEATLSMRSSFGLMPLNSKGFILFDEKKLDEDERDASETPLNMNLWDPNDWVKYKLSPLVDEGSEEDRKKVFDYISKQLKSHKQFLEKSKIAPKTKPRPPIALLASRSVPTVKECLVPSIEHLRAGDHTRLRSAEGDGVVTWESSLALPEQWKGSSADSDPAKDGELCTVVETDRGHVGLLADLKAVDKALGAILEYDGRSKPKMDDEKAAVEDHNLIFASGKTESKEPQRGLKDGKHGLEWQPKGDMGTRDGIHIM